MFTSLKQEAEKKLFEISCCTNRFVAKLGLGIQFLTAEKLYSFESVAGFDITLANSAFCTTVVLVNTACVSFNVKIVKNKLPVLVSFLLNWK